MPIDPKYEILPESFVKKGRQYDLMKRTDAVALYAVKVCDKVGYEVWDRRFNDELTTKMPGGQVVTFRPKEVVPPDSAFGKWAWAFSILSLAQNRFDARELALGGGK